MKRRHFLLNSGTFVGLSLFQPGLGVRAHAMPGAFTLFNTNTDRVLVLIRMSGGNDGLNTLVPLDQYDDLQHVRPRVILPQSRLLNATDTLGLHPAMTGIRELFDRGECKLVQNVGYPNQNRSHFRSMEIWSTGFTDGDSPSPSMGSTGWLGRHLNQDHSAYPEGYPNAEHPDPFAISMGYYVSETCQGRAANYSISLNDPFSLRPLSQSDDLSPNRGYFAEELEFVRSIMTQANAYGSRIQRAAEQGANQATYPGTKLAQQLKNVALLISGGLGTKIYVVDIGGFDTHGGQVDSSDTTKGVHAGLLQTVSEAVLAFQNDLRAGGHDQRVLTMTFSEFGRQIADNQSRGTDHGSSAPMMIFGPCVNPMVLGSNPNISRTLEPQAGVPMEFDFRDVYGTVLQDWFGVPESSVRSILHAAYSPLDLLSGCSTPEPNPEPQPEPQPEPTEDPVSNAFDFQLRPNPCDTYTRIKFETLEERCRVVIFNANGSVKRTIMDNDVGAGEKNVRVGTRRWASATYYVQIELSQSGTASKPLIRVDDRDALLGI